MREYGRKLTKKKNKVVVDTDVLMSAFAFGGAPEAVARRVLSEMEIYVIPAWAI